MWCFNKIIDCFEVYKTFKFIILFNNYAKFSQNIQNSKVYLNKQND